MWWDDAALGLEAHHVDWLRGAPAPPPLALG